MKIEIFSSCIIIALHDGTMLMGGSFAIVSESLL
jgi:hypothetical protein